ncbi:MAG: hypothetical protein ACHQUC_10870, partial [Chlamydiales bacterium]
MQIIRSFESLSQEKRDVESQVGRLNRFLGDCDQINQCELSASSTNEKGSLSQDLQEVGELFLSFIGLGEAAADAPAISPPREIRKIEYDHEVISNLERDRKRMSQIYLTLAQKIDGYTKHSSCLEEKTVELLELEKAFEEARRDFTLHKCQLLNPLPQALDPLKGKYQVEDLQSQIRLELVGGQAEIENIQKRITQIQDQILACKLQGDEERKSFLEQLTQIYLVPLEAMSQELEGQYHAHIRSMGEFLDLPTIAQNSARLESSKDEIQTQFRNYQSILQELRDHLTQPHRTLNQANLEYYCRQATIELHLVKQTFQKKRADANLLKSEILKKEIHSRRIDQSSEEIKRVLKGFAAETTSIAKELKKASQELRVQKEKSQEDTSSFSEIADRFCCADEYESLQSWSSTNWGSLLIHLDGGKSWRDQLGIGFERSVNRLKEARNELRAQISSDDSGQLEMLTQQLNQVDRLLYHTLLNRIIEVVGEKQRLLKKHSHELTPQQMALLQIEVELLNA